MGLIDKFGIEVRLAQNKGDIEQGLDFISTRYREEFGIQHLQPPEHLIIAWAGNGNIQGTLGVNTALYGKDLRVLTLYDTEFSGLGPEIQNRPGVEFARWISGSRKVSCVLIYRAIQLSLELGKEIVWCEHNRSVNRAARSFGIDFTRVENAVLKWSLLEKEYFGFYKKIKTELFFFSLEQARTGVESYLSRRA